MVTMKDITNMGRKIKRSNNPKTLARYQAQIDAWIAELAQDQARTQADILALEEKIKLEEEARAAQSIAGGDRKSEEYKKSVSIPGIPSDSTKKVAVKIAEKAGVSPRKCYSYFEFERLHLRRSRA
jgi:peptidoglycan hydrolase CwlO-like protein